MKRFYDVLALVYGCLFSFVMMAQSPRPPIVDKGTTEVYGDLNRYSRGQLSDFNFSGMDFSRHEGPFEPDPFSDYRVELTLADGTVVSAFLVLDESEASNEPIPEAESRVGTWQACFPSVLEAKELRILYMNQVVYSTKPPNGPLPYQPVLTQIDKDKVRIEPVQVEEVEYAYRGEQLTGSLSRKTFFENGVLTLPASRIAIPNQPPVVMVDVCVGLRRHTTWLVMDPTFVPPPPSLTRLPIPPPPK